MDKHTNSHSNTAHHNTTITNTQWIRKKLAAVCDILKKMYIKKKKNKEDSEVVWKCDNNKPF